MGAVSNQRQVGRISLYKVILRNSGLVDDALQQKFTKARRMNERQSDIFIQMKGLNLVPVDACHPRQRFQELKLRVARRKNDAATIPLSDGQPYRGRSLLSRRPCEQSDIVK